MLAIAFCDRELLWIFVHYLRVSNQTKFVAAECGDHHAKSVRSPEFRERALPNEITAWLDEGISLERLAAHAESVRLGALW